MCVCVCVRARTRSVPCAVYYNTGSFSSRCYLDASWLDLGTSVLWGQFTATLDCRASSLAYCVSREMALNDQ